LFREVFPAVFKDPPVPLAIGVGAVLTDLTAGELAPWQVGAALRLWTRCSAYQQALAVADSIRFNLDGSLAGPVAEGHRAHARRAR
jgi:sRNA-binding protein